MSVKINASTSSGLVVDSDLTGSLQLQTGGNDALTVNSSQVVNFTKQFQFGGVLPPAFSAYIGTDQTITASVNTKIAFNTEEYDTASRYNNTGSTVGGIPAYAFLPNVAGYYFINLNFWIGNSTGTYTRWNGKIYKNGSEYSRVSDLVLSGGYGTAGGCLMYLNGSTDYVEAYANIGTSGTAIVGAGGTVVNLFQGYMVRAA